MYSALAGTMRRFGSLIPAALAFLVFHGPGFAQVTATISGQVVDASGAAVHGASITVKSLETAAARSTTTDEAGRFALLSLPLGPQEVKAEKAGFKTAIRTGINLQLGQHAVVNLRLEVGELYQPVTVSGD